MNPVDRPELAHLSLYSPTMLRVLLSDLGHELESLDQHAIRLAKVRIEIRSRMMRVRSELRKRNRTLALPTWPTSGGATQVLAS